MKAKLPWNNICTLNVLPMWWKATAKGFGTLPAPHPVYAAANFFKWPSFKSLRSSYNPSNSCWNNHCYTIKHLSVVRPSRIGCRSVWLKGTPSGSRLLPSPQPVYTTKKNFKWEFYQINNFEARTPPQKKQLEILFLYILNMLSIKRLILIATEIWTT